MKQISDKQFAEWARRIGRADESALDELFDATFEAYVKYAWRYLSEKEAALDVVQECFIKLWQYRERLDPSRSLRSYLYRMVRNRALNELRDRQRAVALEEDRPLPAPEADWNPVPEPQGTPLEGAFRQWIAQLPERQREAFELSRFEGLIHEEIAEVMEISERTVNNHIVAALGTLKEHYQQYKAERPLS